MIYDPEEPYGGPENYDQQMRESERYYFSKTAIARFYQLILEKGLHLNDLGHFQHLLSECRVDQRDIEHFLAKKEAA
jgi:hypothetical protein